jgi:hypothetical protein
VCVCVCDKQVVGGGKHMKTYSESEYMLQLLNNNTTLQLG